MHNGDLDRDRDPDEGPEWTDIAGAARAVCCTTETITRWVRKYFAREDAFQVADEVRGAGHPWRINVAALHQVAIERGRSRWYPLLARPTYNDPVQVIELLNTARDRIHLLEAENTRLRHLERYGPPPPAARVAGPSSAHSDVSTALMTPPPRPRPPTRTVPLRRHPRDTFPDRWVSVSTWCRTHNINPRALDQAIEGGRFIQPMYAPEGHPWINKGQYEIKTAFTAEQHAEACALAHAKWPTRFQRCGPDCPYDPNHHEQDAATAGSPL